jgi:hypothetical protein
MLSRLAAAAVLAIGVLAAAPATRAQAVRGEVLSVGFPSQTPAGFVARRGQWIPLAVRLSGAGSEPLACRLTCELHDVDGDLVDFRWDAPPVNPTARDTWCYVVTQPYASDPLVLKVLSEAGQFLLRLDVPDFDPLASDEQLVLDISDAGLPLLHALADERRLYRRLQLGRLPARRLPDRWFGLESVSMVVWDKPDPQGLSGAQLDALREWVRRGGHLLLGLGEAWPRVRGSPLADLLPIAGEEAALHVDSLPIFFERYAGGAHRFRAPIPVARVRPRSDRQTWRVLTDLDDRNNPVPLVLVGMFGSGRVTVSGAGLADLSSGVVERSATVALLEELLGVNRVPEAMAAKEVQQLALSQARPLYDALIRRIEFQQVGTVLVLVAVLFVLAYILASTFVSWFWLVRIRRTHWSWSVFAGFAVVFSVVSIGAVQLTRGCQEVHSVSLLNLEAGSRDAHGWVFFGYRSPNRQRNDLSVSAQARGSEGAGELNYVRGLTTGRPTTAHYATAWRYVAEPAQTHLRDVLMRATLKQFEAAWSGALAGTIRGQLTARRSDGRITDESWLESDLPSEVREGYLLYVDPRVRDAVGGDVPLQAAGLTTPYRPGYRGASEVPSAASVLALAIGPLPPGQRRDRLGAAEYEQLDLRLKQWSSGAHDPREQPEPATLWDRQVSDWMPSLGPTLSYLPTGRIDPAAAGALMLSTSGLYLHNSPRMQQPLFESVGTRVSIEGLPDADVSAWLLRGQAVLLAWCEAPGPATLERDGRAIRSSAGCTLYRARLPLRYAGEPGTQAPAARPSPPGTPG